MAVGKIFEIYQESDASQYLWKTETSSPLYTPSSHTVKIYSPQKLQSKARSHLGVDCQLCPNALGMPVSPPPVLPMYLRERVEILYGINPYCVPYSLDTFEWMIIQSPFKRTFPLPQASVGLQETVTQYTVYEDRLL